VGKGRQIAALTKECWNQGVRRILWVSTSTDLKYDAERDLADVAASDIPVHPKVRTRLPSFFFFCNTDVRGCACGWCVICHTMLQP
jgi:hypothetical protein